VHSELPLPYSGAAVVQGQLLRHGCPPNPDTPLPLPCAQNPLLQLLSLGQASSQQLIQVLILRAGLGKGLVAACLLG
jgi:hypothetical protein